MSPYDHDVVVGRKLPRHKELGVTVALGDHNNILHWRGLVIIDFILLRGLSKVEVFVIRGIISRVTGDFLMHHTASCFHKSTTLTPGVAM